MAPKKCNKCGHVHATLPEGGKYHVTGYYFQCSGGCSSTMFVPTKKLSPALARRCA